MQKVNRSDKPDWHPPWFLNRSTTPENGIASCDAAYRWCRPMSILIKSQIMDL